MLPLEVPLGSFQEPNRSLGWVRAQKDPRRDVALPCQAQPPHTSPTTTFLFSRSGLRSNFPVIAFPLSLLPPSPSALPPTWALPYPGSLWGGDGPGGMWWRRGENGARETSLAQLDPPHGPCLESPSQVAGAALAGVGLGEVTDETAAVSSVRAHFHNRGEE